MTKNNLAIIIIVLCIFCLIVGMANLSKKTVLPQNMSEVSNIKVANPCIALINIEGVISSDSPDSFFEQGFSANNIINSLERAKKDKMVKGVLIRINSPGGTVAASQDIYDAIMRFRKEKPIVVSMADVTASGGYYIASAADRIVAQKGTMTGSIGVIFNFVDGAQLIEKIGVNSNVIKSGKFKDAGSPYRRMTNDEQELFQSSVNGAYKQFISAIEEGRIKRDDKYKAEKTNLTKETLENFADGRVFLGDEAKELGFVDSLGSQYDAHKIIAEMAEGDIDNLPLTQYNKGFMIGGTFIPLDGLFNLPKNILPFSLKKTNMPLMIME